MNNFSLKVQGTFMVMVMAGLTALLSKAFNQGNSMNHFNNALDSIEKFNLALNEELPE